MKCKLSLSFEEVSEWLISEFCGVGMIRGEYLLKRTGSYITKEHVQDELVRYVSMAAGLFTGYDVWYRTIELPTNWISELDGADHIIYEKDFMAGLRGIRRSLRYPDIFKLETGLISNLSKKHPNVHILLPFISSVSEFLEAKNLLKKVGYYGKVGIMAEIPATILCLEEFCKARVDNITIGLNDLTEFTLASARNLEMYNRTHPAVIKMLASAIEIGKKYKIETILGGNHSKESIRIGEELGFDGITVFIQDIPQILNKIKKINKVNQKI